MSTDPRNLVDTVISGVTATEDDGITAATIIRLYEGGPETLQHLFYTVGADAIISIERHMEQESGDGKRRQDIPIRYTATVPFTVTAVDKTGITATKLLNKIRLSLITQVETNATDADYTYMLQRDENASQRMGGYDPLWIDSYRIIQRPLVS